MKIDATRYKAFLRNPEAYRLRYVQNLALPTESLGYGLQRGTAFHIISEAKFKGVNGSQLEKLLREKVPDAKARKQAGVMHRAFEKHYAGGGPATQAVEKEFCLEMMGIDICGRLDEIVERNGAVWVGERKTANRKATYLGLKHQWKYDPQADFVILGARHLGYPVEGVLVRTITEHVPSKVWEHEVMRTTKQLETFACNARQVCGMIEYLMQEYGPDRPWPHNGWSWPCSTPGKCEYERICSKTAPPTAELSKFVPRVEHLEILK